MHIDTSVRRAQWGAIFMSWVAFGALITACGPDRFIRQLADHKNELRDEAMRKLAADFRDDPAAQDALIDALQDSELSVQFTAIRAVGECWLRDSTRQIRACRELVKLLEDNQIPTLCFSRRMLTGVIVGCGPAPASRRVLALNSLCHITEVDLGFDQKAWTDQIDRMDTQTQLTRND